MTMKWTRRLLSHSLIHSLRSRAPLRSIVRSHRSLAYFGPHGKEAFVSGMNGSISYHFNPPCNLSITDSAAISFRDCTVCYSGHYCDVPGLGIPKICPPGKFCPTGTSNPTPCPLGFYSNSSGLRGSEECIPCDGGKYCNELGSTKPTGECDPGFYCITKAFSPVRFICI